MKKIIFITALLITGIGTQAQFPTTDSLVKFINRYIRNSAVEAFQNLRLNTALIGMTRFIDSAYGGQVKSFTAVNDSTIRLITLGNDTFNVVLRFNNLATGPLTATGDYSHNWAQNNLNIDSIKNLGIVSRQSNGPYWNVSGISADNQSATLASIVYDTATKRRRTITAGMDAVTGFSGVQLLDSDSSGATSYLQVTLKDTPRTEINRSLVVKERGWFMDTLTATTMGNPDSSHRVASTAWVKRQGYGTGSGTVTTDTTLTGSGSSGSPLKVDTSRIASLRALKDSTLLILNNLLILSRIEFTQGSTSSTYQNDTLIGKNISTIEIGGYPIGFVARSNSVYISSFDSGTGTITLTNGVFDTGDYVKILFRTPPIYLLDANGWPVKDSNGNYIILN